MGEEVEKGEVHLPILNVVVVTLLLLGPFPFAVNASNQTSYGVFGSSPLIVTFKIEALTVITFLMTLESVVFFR